jgi:hypothetical protein
MSRHGRREVVDVEHCDRQRFRLNRAGSKWANPDDVRACVEGAAVDHGARWRKGAPRASHVLVTASPSFFRPGDPDAVGTWDQARLDAWLAANLEWASRRWPNQIACWRLDLDESTPHCDIFVVPINRYRTRGGREVTEVSHRSAFGSSRRSFAELQDDYATAMAPLGLARGRPRSVTKAHHVNPAEFRRKLKVEAERSKAMRIGAAGLLRGDITNLSLNAAGELAVDFHARVPMGARPRFLHLMRPARSELAVFQRRMAWLAKRHLKEMADILFDAAQEREAAQKDRKDAADILFDAGLELLELRRLMGSAPAGREAKIRDLAAALTRHL